MTDMADDIEWVTPGNSAVSGTLHGKEEVGRFWAQLAEKGFTTEPQHWFSDEQRVVVLCHTSMGGDEADTADVMTYGSATTPRCDTAAIWNLDLGTK